MKESIQTVRAYYDENARKERDRLAVHPFEFLLTTYMRPAPGTASGESEKCACD